jgi:hypothetical protein
MAGEDRQAMPNPKKESAENRLKARKVSCMGLRR